MLWKRQRIDVPAYLILIDAMLLECADLRDELPLKFRDKRNTRRLDTVQGILSNMRHVMTPNITESENPNL